MAEEAMAWVSKVAELANGDGLAAKCQALKDRVDELRDRYVNSKQ